MFVFLLSDTKYENIIMLTNVTSIILDFCIALHYLQNHPQSV